MKITSTDKSATIEIDNYKNTYPLNTLWYQKTQDGISILQDSRSVATSPISLITVDGTQLTSQNADSLLTVLFKQGSSGGAGDEQIQSDYTEKNTSSKAYIKNKPYYELSVGDTFPADAITGATAVCTDNTGKKVSSWVYDGFVWIQQGADYNLIFEQESRSDSSRLFDYEFLKINGKMHYAKYPLGTLSTSSAIYARRIDKISKDYTLSEISLIIDEGSDVGIKTVKSQRVGIYSKKYPNSGNDTMGSIVFEDIESNMFQNGGVAKDITFKNIKPLEDEINRSQLTISVKAQNIALDNVEYLTDFRADVTLLSADGVDSRILLKDVIGRKYDLESYAHGSTLYISNYSNEGIAPKLSLIFDNVKFTSLQLYGFSNERYGSQVTKFDTVGISDFTMLNSISISVCDFLVPQDFIDFIDRIIAAGGTRKNASINLSAVNVTINETQKSALEELGFQVNIY